MNFEVVVPKNDISKLNGVANVHILLINGLPVDTRSVTAAQINDFNFTRLNMDLSMFSRDRAIRNDESITLNAS